MKRKAVRVVVAVLTLGLAGVMVIPGCVIKLGKGGPDETESTADNTGGSSGAGGQGGAPEDPFEGLDPVAVNREGLRASAAGYLLQGMVQQAAELQGLDSDNIDEATTKELVEGAWPGALEQAEQWLSTLEPSVFEVGVTPNAPYCHGLGCPSKMYCDSAYYGKTITCSLQACGDASCKACPDWFGPLKNLVITAWCSYVCVDGGMVVGSAAYVVTRLVDFQRCLLP